MYSCILFLFLLRALECLPGDTVFARARCIKVDENWSVSSVEAVNSRALNSITYFKRGLEIAECGSIHVLAFISQLIINPLHWKQGFHDSIYAETDLYTYVLTLLRSCSCRGSASLEFHITAATDRGDRSYYTPDMCVARLTEYAEYERYIHEVLGKRKARIVLERIRRNMLPLANCLVL